MCKTRQSSSECSCQSENTSLSGRKSNKRLLPSSLHNVLHCGSPLFFSSALLYPGHQVSLARSSLGSSLNFITAYSSAEPCENLQTVFKVDNISKRLNRWQWHLIAPRSPSVFGSKITLGWAGRPLHHTLNKPKILLSDWLNKLIRSLRGPNVLVNP